MVNNKLTTSLSRRYARAFFEMAQEAKVLETVRADGEALVQGLQTCADLQHFFAYDLQPAQVRRQTLQRLFEHQGHALLKQFVLFLEIKGRLAYFIPIMDEFIKMVEAIQGVLPVEVSTAFALTEDERGDVKQYLTQKWNKRIVLQERLDPSMLGGIKVRVGDVMFDYGVKTQLDRFYANVLKSKS